MKRIIKALTAALIVCGSLTAVCSEYADAATYYASADSFCLLSTDIEPTMGDGGVISIGAIKGRAKALTLTDKVMKLSVSLEIGWL